MRKSESLHQIVMRHGRGALSECLVFDVKALDQMRSHVVAQATESSPSSTSPLVTRAGVGARRNLAIVAHNGQGNLGDEAVSQALVERLRQRNLNGEIVCFSMDPADTARRLGVTSYGVRPGADETLARGSGKNSSDDLSGSNALFARPGGVAWLGVKIRQLPWLLAPLRAARSAFAIVGSIAAEARFVWRSYRRLRGTALLVIAGSNQILDSFGGLWGYPYTLLRWTVLARAVGAKVMVVSMGAGPVKRRSSWLLFRMVLGLAAYISFRDEGSLRLVREHVQLPSACTRPDLAYSLRAFHADDGTSAPPVGPLTVALNPVPVNDPRYWPNADADAYHTYVRRMADMTRALVDRGHRVKYFSTQPADEFVIDDVREELSAGCPIDIVRPRETTELVNLLRAADAIVAARYHGILFALACARPVLAVCYYRKSRELMEAAGMPQYAVDIDRIDASWCAAAVDSLLDQRTQITARLRTHVLAQASELDKQYDRLVELWTLPGNMRNMGLT